MANNILRFWKSLDSDDPLEPLFEASPVLLHCIDSEGVLVKVSRFWADKLGYTPEEMLGRKSTELLSEPSQEYAKTVILPEFYRTGSIYNVEYDFLRKDGSILPVLMSAIAQYDEKDGFVRSLAIMFDNTEAKRATAALLQSQRMEAIGSLVGGVAHDFNNLLAVIQGNLEFLLIDPDDKDRDEFIHSAITASQRGAVLTQQLLSYGRRARLSPIMIDVNDNVRSADRLVRRLLPSNIVLQTVTRAGLWKIEADAALLETAILNILNNACDAMPEGGRITIETCNVRISEGYIGSCHEKVDPGRYVMLAISDTGHGIDETTLAKVFEPFFTTKPPGIGSGLGLSMVFGFMRQSNGAIRAYSEVGVGTTFKLYFPTLEGNVHQPEIRHNAPRKAKDGRLVLIAEDEKDVRKILAKQLRAADLTVKECPSGDEALRQIVGGLRPDVLLTDIVMPGSVQGPELAARAREIHPGIKVLFISGYPTEAAIHGNGLQPNDISLVKPVSKSELLQAVHQLLESKDKYRF